MKALTFKLKLQLKFTLDISPLTPDNLSGKIKKEIENIKIEYGDQHIPVSQLFSISGSDPENIKILNSCDKLVYIGKGMSYGTIEVSGNAGDYIGQHMQGGCINIEGNAGAWAGSSMDNGQININGNAGDYLGAGLPGTPYGMSDGLIYVTGNAGDRAGDCMRRGFIIIRGKAGNYCGSRMAAGTIIILDKAGKYPGFGMKRGTIIIAKKPGHIAATFKSCGNLKMQFLRLLFKQLSEFGEQFSFFSEYAPDAHRFAGDLASSGKGEILILQTFK